MGGGASKRKKNEALRSHLLEDLQRLEAWGVDVRPAPDAGASTAELQALQKELDEKKDVELNKLKVFVVGSATSGKAMVLQELSRLCGAGGASEGLVAFEGKHDGNILKFCNLPYEIHAKTAGDEWKHDAAAVILVADVKAPPGEEELEALGDVFGSLAERTRAFSRADGQYCENAVLWLVLNTTGFSGDNYKDAYDTVVQHMRKKLQDAGQGDRVFRNNGVTFNNDGTVDGTAADPNGNFLEGGFQSFYDTCTKEALKNAGFL